MFGSQTFERGQASGPPSPDENVGRQSIDMDESPFSIPAGRSDDPSIASYNQWLWPEPSTKSSLLTVDNESACARSGDVPRPLSQAAPTPRSWTG